MGENRKLGTLHPPRRHPGFGAAEDRDPQRLSPPNEPGGDAQP